MKNCKEVQSRNEPLPIDEEPVHTVVDLPEPIDLATYEGKYPRSLSLTKV